MSWRFIAYDRATGTALGELIDLQSRQFSLYRNQPPQATAQLPIESPRNTTTLLQSGVTEMKIIDPNGNAVESVFVLTTKQYDLDVDGGSVALGWEGIASYLADAGVLKQTTASTAGQAQLAWNLINEYQLRTGTVSNITQGLVPSYDPSVTLNREDNMELLQAIIDLSSLDPGFDWNVNTDREFDCYYPTRGSDNGLVLEVGVNCFAASIPEDAGPGRLTSDATVTTNGGIVATGTNTDIRTTYGRREAFATYDQDSSTLAAAYASSIVNATASPVGVPEVTLNMEHPTVQWGSFGIADVVTVRANLGEAGWYEAEATIAAIHGEIDENDNITVKLELNEA